MEKPAADNWWDRNHKDENLLRHFSDKELQTELNNRQVARRKLEIMKIVGTREIAGYFIVPDSNEHHTEWDLNIVFSNGTKHCFTFSSKVGQNESDVESFKALYFPNLARLELDYAVYQRMAAKQNSAKKKKVCRSRR